MRVDLPSLSLAVVATFASGVFADRPPDADIDQLRSEVAALRAEVQRLKSMTGDDRLTEERAREIRGLIEEVVADADRRASLLQDGLTAGWAKGKGFHISSVDGNFLLRIYGQIQVRYVANFQDNSPTGEDSRSGFESPCRSAITPVSVSQ